MNPYQEPKYEIKDGKIVNRQSGVAIPDDEPVFILRARDAYAARTVSYYANLSFNAEHAQAVKIRAAQFHNWAACNNIRMKLPDTQQDEGWTSAGTPPAQGS